MAPARQAWCARGPGGVAGRGVPERVPLQPGSRLEKQVLRRHANSLSSNTSSGTVCAEDLARARHHMALHSLCLLKDTFSVHRLLKASLGHWVSLLLPLPVRPLWCEDFHIHLDLKAKHSISLAPITTCMGSRRCLTSESQRWARGFGPL